MFSVIKQKNSNKLLLQKNDDLFDFEIEITVTEHGWLVSEH